jgi:hypothetical protein
MAKLKREMGDNFVRRFTKIIEVPYVALNSATLTLSSLRSQAKQNSVYFADN